jgi:hypothetical protein
MNAGLWQGNSINFRAAFNAGNLLHTMNGLLK